MKKIISAIITASMLTASFVMPVFADYKQCDYDVKETMLTFPDGTATNDIDGSSALQVGADQVRIYETTINSTLDFFLTFDFRFDNADGYFETPMSTGNAKVGLCVTLADGKLRTQTGSSSYQQLGNFTIGKWYTAEIEGKTGTGSAKDATFRLYDETGTLVQETKNLDFRNIKSSNRYFSYINAHDISIDNIMGIQLYPDSIEVTALSDTMNAGSDNSFACTMTRENKDITQYDVKWSVYNEANTELLNDDKITIDKDKGKLSVNKKAESQTVTVRATATLGERELYGSKQIRIEGINTANEVFDDITISGNDEMKAGTSQTLTYTASKNEAPVTPADIDIVWGIYDRLGVTENNDRNFSIENGVLTVADGTFPQDITVRASSTSGLIYANFPVSIKWSDSQKENVLSYTPCETAIAGANLVDSWDGSKAYETTGNKEFSFTEQKGYYITEYDIKFDGVDGHGMTMYGGSGSEIPNIRCHNSGLGQQTGGSSWDTVLTQDDFDVNTWYHVEFLYLNDNTSGYNIYKYNADGTKTLIKAMPNCNKRNNKAYNKVAFTQGVTIDNFKVAEAAANEIKVTTTVTSIFSGDGAEYSVTASRNGHVMDGASGITWEVRDENNDVYLGDAITINNGVLTTTPMAPVGMYKIRAVSAAGYNEASLEIKFADYFEVTNLGVDEDGKIVRIYVNKLLGYNDDVMFIIIVRDANGVLKGYNTVQTFGDKLVMGENEVPANFDPSEAGFNPENGDTVEVLVWTSMK